MKNRFAVMLFLLFMLTGCTKTLNMNNVINEPHFSGIVTEVSEGSITVKVNEDDAAYNSSSFIVVSLDVEIKDGLSEYAVGYEVCVYYNGEIAESDPAQVHTVYAITIVNENNENND